MEPNQKQRIEELYLAMHDMLLVYGQTALQSRTLAEEAVQETFRIACTKPEAVLGSPNPQGWLVNTLKNVIANTVKERNRTQRILAEYLTSCTRNPGTEDQLSLDVQHADLFDQEDYRLIRGIAIEGKTILELAREREISLNACKKRVQRARENLRKYFSE